MFGIDDAAAATLAVGGLGFLGQQMTNSANQSNAQAQMDYQTEMSNTAYQRQVKDLEAAGLNPMLAYIKGGGASTPSGAMATYQSPVSGAVQAATSAKTPSDIRLTTSQTSASDAQSKQIDASTDKIKQEIENLKSDNDRVKQLILNLAEEKQNLMKTGMNLTEQGNVLRATISKLGADVSWLNAKTSREGVLQSLDELDLDAARKFDNFGREFKQYEPIIQLLKSVLRSGR